MKTTHLHILSAGVLAVFIFTAIASIDFSILTGVLNTGWHTNSEFLGNRTQKVTSVFSSDTTQAVESITGQFDGRGRWTGPVTFVQGYWNADSAVHIRKEWTINFVEGKKHGKGVLHFKRTPPGNLVIDTLCYNMDKKVDCDDFVESRRNDRSAYDVFTDRYPLRWYDFYSFGFDEIYMEAYMDSLQSIISSYDFDAGKFDEYYDDALDTLEMTPYDSLSRLNQDFFILRLLDLMKNGTFRLAVFDRYLTDYESTFEIIKNLYPDYLDNLVELGLPEADFQIFCHVYDSLLNTYNTLDVDEDLFPFRLDSQIYRAYNEIDSVDTEDDFEGPTEELAILIDQIKRLGFPGQKRLGVLKDVKNSILLWSIFEFFFEADAIRESQREAYYQNNQVAIPAVVTTSFIGNSTGNRAEVEGFVVSDGGASITQRGMAWANHNNPTIEEDTLHAEGELGSFTVTLTGLAPDETYFARSFAINSAGIAYGNSVRFIAEEISSTHDEELFEQKILIYPNPASTFINMQREEGFGEVGSIQIFDLSGRSVLTIACDQSDSSEKILTLDISALPDGVYTCNLTHENGKRSTGKFVVAH